MAGSGLWQSMSIDRESIITFALATKAHINPRHRRQIALITMSHVEDGAHHSLDTVTEFTRDNSLLNAAISQTFSHLERRST